MERKTEKCVSPALLVGLGWDWAWGDWGLGGLWFGTRAWQKLFSITQIAGPWIGLAPGLGGYNYFGKRLTAPFLLMLLEATGCSEPFVAKVTTSNSESWNSNDPFMWIIHLAGWQARGHSPIQIPNWLRLSPKSLWAPDQIEAPRTPECQEAECVNMMFLRSPIWAAEPKWCKISTFKKGSRFWVGKNCDKLRGRFSY